MTKKKIGSMLLKTGIVVALAVFVLGCSLGGTTLTGEASKGPISGGTVTVYALGSDGTRGAKIASTTTNADGSYLIDLGDYSGAVAVVVTGGSYTDEATGTTVTLGAGDELETLLASAGDGSNVAVTALTTIAAARAAENAADGLATAIDAANNAVAAEFGISGLDISSILPSDLTQSATSDTAEEQAYGAILSGISQVALNNSLTPSDVLELIAKMASDFEDGVFDGKDAAGYALTVAGSLAPDVAKTGLETAVTNFLDSTRNTSGVSLLALSSLISFQ